MISKALLCNQFQIFIYVIHFISNTICVISRLMFWSQSYDSTELPKIMKATLSGENPTEIVLTYGDPVAIALDYDTKR